MSIEWFDFIRARVHGTPKGQPRPRAFARSLGARVSVRVYDPGSAEGWKGQIALALMPLRPEHPIEGPIRVDAVYLFARPARLNGKRGPEGRVPHVARPDVDNLSKSLFDALVQLGVMADDCQVCAGSAEKWYAARGEAPGAEVRIFRDRWAELASRSPGGSGAALFAGAAGGAK